MELIALCTIIGISLWFIGFISGKRYERFKEKDED